LISRRSVLALFVIGFPFEPAKKEENPSYTKEKKITHASATR
jgi:hypothetical protein